MFFSHLVNWQLYPRVLQAGYSFLYDSMVVVQDQWSCSQHVDVDFEQVQRLNVPLRWGALYSKHVSTSKMFEGTTPCCLFTQDVWPWWRPIISRQGFRDYQGWRNTCAMRISIRLLATKEDEEKSLLYSFNFPRIHEEESFQIQQKPRP